MAEGQLDRSYVKEQLGILRPQMMAMFASQKEGQPIYGELMELALESGVRKMRHYSSGKEAAPVYFDVHGGGYTWGTIEDGDHFCQEICETFGWEAYTLDYPLTPDEEYPAQLQWVYETISHMREHAAQFHIDPERMVIGGRSAGGNMAAVLCLYAKEKGEFQFAAQVLDHPWLDLCGITPWDAEHRYLGEGALTADVMMALTLGYVDFQQMADKLVSPDAAPVEDLKGLPPAIVQTCELDSLRPDGDLYAQHLQEAGVSVIHHCMEGAIHGFTEAETELSEQGRQWLIEQLKKTVNF